MNATEKVLDLLTQAHGTLTQAVIPSASKQERYDCLMIANALRIVERHFRASPENGLTAMTDGLLGEVVIVKGIRAGQFDAGCPMRTQLIANLRDRLARQLVIDNPRLVEQLTQPPREADGHGFFH
ncbi:DUF6285 domain-containing protein [Trinickia mobilis]|uniref:DUF6285 domain-containing protein n=1 Tax=Trinickia mobilis TaxID=2816356 RepID=UPI001A8D2066|nr:DUF6285 domain-containing protein [Trinickia mobilis]